MPESVKDIPKVDFIDGMTLEQLESRIKSRYEQKKEELTGYPASLQPADESSLILSACAVYMFQGFQFVQRAGEQNMLGMSYGNALDQLGALAGVTRKDAQAAVCTLKFTLSEKMTSVTSIPQGTMASASGQVYFATTEYAEIPAGQLSVEVSAACTVTGEVGNGYAAGTITTMIDRIGYVESVTNVNATAGGADTESDESRADKIFLAPSGFSVAGPTDAYAYFCKAHNSQIDDVYVDSPTPGSVVVYITMEGSKLPEEAVIEDLEEYLKDDQVRPLTDNVSVSAPQTVDYSVSVKYWINRSSAGQAAALQEDIEAAVQSYIEWQQAKIGRDINPDQLIQMMVAAGAKRVEITAPAFKSIQKTQIPAITDEATVTYGGVEDD